jgi:hypothetical protein
MKLRERSAVALTDSPSVAAPASAVAMDYSFRLGKLPAER